MSFGAATKQNTKDDESAFFAEAQVVDADVASDLLIVGPPPTIKLLSSRLTRAQTGGQMPQMIEHNGRIVLRWPGVSLRICAERQHRDGRLRLQAEQGVKMYDANADGYLEEKEVNEQVQAQFARFEADSDADGKVYPGEVAAFLKQRQGGAASPDSSPRAGSRGLALFGVPLQGADPVLISTGIESSHYKTELSIHRCVGERCTLLQIESAFLNSVRIVDHEEAARRADHPDHQTVVRPW